MRLIDYIEDENMEIDDNVYYHAFSYCHKDFINMIKEGIKCPILIGKRSRGNNGLFYVSLSRKEKCESSIHERMNHLPMFVVDGNIKTIKVKKYYENPFDYSWATDLPIPLRESEYDDEYQKFYLLVLRTF